MDKSELHKKFVKLGQEKSHISHQLLALLPEIFEKSVFLDYGCGSIYEYAARFGDGLSAGVVDKVLKLKENLSECPSLFETVATQGVHKVAIIASLANSKTEKELVEVVKNMSKDAVQEYSKVKRGKKVRIMTKIEMDEEMEFLFLKLKKKLKTVSNKETMKRLLQAMDRQLFPEEKVSGDGGVVKKITRYIPKAKKRELYQETLGRCAYDGCNRPIDTLHHTDGYSKTKNHNNVVGLCEIHHQFAHNGIDRPLVKMDLLYRRYRQRALVAG
ncbi:MAG: hypothetical protein Q8P62_01650 [Candidatus Peregrinibacteria bacterium]|nr:hypothetical protein [Candidatus Peregrinibacteria bacterium]